MGVFGSFDYAITRDQTMRIRYFHNQSTSKNLGIGGVDRLERGYSSDDHNDQLMFQEAGPLGRRFFTNTRGWISWTRSDSRSLFEGPTIIIPEISSSRTVPPALAATAPAAARNGR